MPNPTKEWLVRTRTRDVIGPFTLRELMDELAKKTFSPEDEIASSNGHWISAQTLQHREMDEVTRTSTRTAALTQSITDPNSEPTAPPSVNGNNLNGSKNPTAPKAVFTAKPTAQKRSNAIPSALLAVALTLALGWIFTRPPTNAPLPAKKETSQSPAGSPFVQNIYDMIQAGDSARALKKLVDYHERNSASGDVEYLIPYAALLITTEGGSPTPARKLLDQVLASKTATPAIKAQAHHWLGYLGLSEKDGDMGESHFLEALQINPRNASTRFNLGRSYLKQRRFSQALDVLQLAELEVPDLWLIHLFKGRAKTSLGNIKDAKQSFLQAIESSRERWITYIYYATFLRLNGQLKEAQEVLHQMLRQDPYYEQKSPPPFGYYQEPIDYEEYLNSFDPVMAQFRDDEDLQLGQLYLHYLLARQNNNSALVARKIEQLGSRESLFAKILILRVLLDREAPVQEIKNAVSRLPANLNPFGYYGYVLRGDAFLSLKQSSEAHRDLERALLLEPKSAVAHHAYAEFLKTINRKSDAEKEIKSLLSYHPTYVPGIISSREY